MRALSVATHSSYLLKSWMNAKCSTPPTSSSFATFTIGPTSFTSPVGKDEKGREREGRGREGSGSGRGRGEGRERRGRGEGRGREEGGKREGMD